MSNTFNVEEVVGCLNVIADLNKCEICDNSSGTRSRYPCGHLACSSCVATHCLLCLTPPSTNSTAPVHDDSSTKRANNANILLQTFQEVFEVDVCKRRKLSEQLKLEREVFPECIQAPSKYYNKRKSSISNKNKENTGPTSFPGEHISPIRSKMENSFNYVQHWLNDSKLTPSRKRKPFSDLTTNQNVNQRIPRRADKILQKVKENAENDLKRKQSSPFKSAKAIVQSQSELNQNLKPTENRSFKRIRRDFEQHDIVKITKKDEKDESGIGMEDDLIVIDDSQSTLLDKDKLAWMAVLEADEKDPYVSSQQLNLEPTEILPCKNDTQETVLHKVPFYKKGYLVEPYSICKKADKLKSNVDKTAGQSKDVSINIESKSFTTTINISTVKSGHSKPGKRSVETQTDISKFNVMEVKDFSEDLFSADAKFKEQAVAKELVREEVKLPTETLPLIITDSDSDDAANESSIIEVTADVHRSLDEENAVLSELGFEQVQERSKRCGRGLTPNSSDSSDKENFDPNKVKKVKPLKKCCKKRKMHDQFEFNSIFSLND